MSFSDTIIEYQCFVCGYMDADFSFFTVVNREELMCIGCHEKYLMDCDTYKEDGEQYGLLSE